MITTQTYAFNEDSLTISYTMNGETLKETIPYGDIQKFFVLKKPVVATEPLDTTDGVVSVPFSNTAGRRGKVITYEYVLRVVTDKSSIDLRNATPSLVNAEADRAALFVKVDA